jgi:hypothetical protein
MGGGAVLTSKKYISCAINNDYRPLLGHPPPPPSVSVFACTVTFNLLFHLCSCCSEM